MEERPDAEHDDGVEPGHGEDDEDDEDERKSSTDAHAPLSKNARKRLLKEQQKDQRKAHRKAEKKIRKQQRAERSVNGDCGGPENGTPNDTVAGAVSTSATALALPPPPSSAEERREVIWAAWKRWGSPKLVLAPMVNQSELAFRLLARHHGARLTYTPMLHSRLFAAEEAYRLENFDEHASDRPLVAQFCGDDPATLVAAARLIQHRCDAVDLNCGCPQGIARRGHYGVRDDPDTSPSPITDHRSPSTLTLTHTLTCPLDSSQFTLVPHPSPSPSPITPTLLHVPSCSTSPISSSRSRLDLT